MRGNIIRPIEIKILRYVKSYFASWGRKKIGFYGNFGHGDLGDDAAFMAAQQLLVEDIVPVSKRCYAFNPHMLKTLLIGGGGILRWEAPYLPRRIYTKKSWPFPLLLFSAGMNCDYNRSYTEEAKNKIVGLCKMCNYVSVRDNLSQRLLKQWGCGEGVLLPDLELALADKSKEGLFYKNRKTVGIVVSPHSEFTESTFVKLVNEFTKTTNYLIHKGFDVLYIPFEKRCSKNTKEGVIIKEIIKNVKGKSKVTVLGENDDPREVLFVIKKYCDVMLCTRLHSAVFAVNAGVPFVCVSYNIMHRGFLEMCGMDKYEVSIFEDFSFHKLEEIFELVLKNYALLRRKIVEKREYFKRLIYKEVDCVKKIMKEEERGQRR